MEPKPHVRRILDLSGVVVGLAATAIVFGVGFSVLLIGYFESRSSEALLLEGRLRDLARTVAHEAGGEIHARASEMKGLAIEQATENLAAIREAIPGLESVYTVVPGPGGLRKFLESKRSSDNPAVTSDAPEPQMPVDMISRVFRDGNALTSIQEDPGGKAKWYTGFAPVRNPEGKIVGVATINLSANEFEAILANTDKALILGSSILLLVSIGVGLFVGLTHRRLQRAVRSETDIAKEKARLAVVARETNTGIALCDKQNRVEWVNEAFLGKFQYALADCIGLPLETILQVPESETRELRRVAARIAARENVSGILQHRCPDGTSFWKEINLQTLSSEDGTHSGYILLTTDATERIVERDSLAKREQALREAQRVAGVGSWSWDVAEDRVEWSEQLYEIFHLDPTKPPPTFAEHGTLYSPESMARLTKAVTFCLESGTPYKISLVSPRPNGTEIRIMAIGQAEFDANGKVVRLFGIAQDVTAQVEAEATVRQSERMFRLISENSRDLIGLLDATGVVEYVSPSVRAILGYTPKEVTGRSLYDFIPVEEHRKLRRLLADAVSVGQDPFEYRMTRKDGTTVWVQTSVSVYPETSASALQLQMISRDISDNRRARETMERNEELLSRTSRMAQVGGWDIDLSTMRPIWSSETRRIHEVTAEFVPNIHRALLFYPPNARKILEEAIDRARNEGKAWDLELPFVTAKSNELWVRTMGFPEIENGVCIRLSGTIQDVTARRRAEEVARDAEQQLRAAFDAVTDLVFIHGINPDGTPSHFVYVNSAVPQLLGVPEDVLLTKRPADLGLIEPNIMRKVAIELRTEGSAIFETHFRSSSGVDVPVEVCSRSFQLRGQQHVVSVARDLSQRKHLEDELIAAKENAEVADRAKSDFLAMMSHEIRTPMNGVIGYASLLEGTRLSEDQKECIANIRSSGEYLVALINDILDLSKIEAGKLEIEEKRIVPAEMLRQAASMFRGACEAKGVAFILQIDASCESTVNADPTRIRQIVGNLLSNAVKFTSAGSVTLRASLSPREGSKFLLRIDVIDTGIGIDRDTAERLFQPFSQADSSTTRRFGGSGLGLAISRRLCERMAGRIGFEPHGEQGSQFWVELTLRQSAPDAVHPPGETPPPTPTLVEGTPDNEFRVLVAEDHPTNQRLIQMMLAKIGYGRVTVVENGVEAVDAVAREPWDLILLDLQMPEMDGMEAARTIREREAEQSGSTIRVPIVALTADAMETTRQHCFAAGMDGYLSKPITTARLREALLPFFQRKSSGDGIASSRTSADI